LCSEGESAQELIKERGTELTSVLVRGVYIGKSKVQSIKILLGFKRLESLDLCQFIVNLVLRETAISDFD